GCDGNLKALSVLAEGMDAGELVRKLRGLRCGRRKTSCADQFARALEQRL
ncbi:MAG: TIGR03905 family TSCPD domain-containing protein, partial [Treponema sp.]|nr:TIGR03905 family TSCPD domain-containing protein [Treponema sp.]